MTKVNKQNIYNQIYSLLLENGEYFRSQFGNMFDSDDDICLEIDHIIECFIFNQPIKYTKQPTKEFHNKLMSLVSQFVKNLECED